MNVPNEFIRKVLNIVYCLCKVEKNKPIKLMIMPTKSISKVRRLAYCIFRRGIFKYIKSKEILNDVKAKERSNRGDNLSA